MSNQLTLDCAGQLIAFEVRRLAAAGYTGRDRAQVQAHIDELAHQGIPAPDRFPRLYEIDLRLLAGWDAIAPSASSVSGEAEAVLLFPTDRLQDAFVSLGSDFTDRVEERISIPRSKQQPKPVGTQVWRYRDVASVWDEISVRSRVSAAEQGPLYQSGTLAQLLAPESLLAQLGEKFAEGGIAGSVLLMGTVPLCGGKFQYTSFFACELELPSGGKLEGSCTVQLPASP